MTKKNIAITPVDPSQPVHDTDELPKKHVVSAPSSLAALHRLRVKGRGLYTSEGENYNNAIFGRDSIIASRELLSWEPAIAHDVILTLASLQGTDNHLLSDEEPGRIHHESRSFKSWKKSPVEKFALKTLFHLWGASYKEMTNYFTIDATPLFILLIADYAKQDPTILSERIRRKNGEEMTVEQSMVDAADWIMNHVADSGLVEVGRHNPVGLFNQAWKDSVTGYIRDDGEMINISEPIAYLNIQSLAVDSLTAAAQLVSEDRVEQATLWRTTAKTIAKNTVERFWIEKEQYFSAVIDRDPHGKPRQINVIQSDAGWLLNSPLLNQLPHADRHKYVTGIITMLFSKDFLTDAGIRSRAVRYADQEKMADYHGSLTSWPIDTYMAARGLRKQGFPRLADQLEARILNSVNMSGDYYEFFYVLPDGAVVLDPDHARKLHKGATSLAVQMYPEAGIAWTVATSFMIKRRRGQHDEIKAFALQSTWEAQLETKVLSSIKQVKAYRSLQELRDNYPQQPNVYFNLASGGAMTSRVLGSQLLKQYLHRKHK